MGSRGWDGMTHHTPKKTWTKITHRHAQKNSHAPAQKKTSTYTCQKKLHTHTKNLSPKTLTHTHQKLSLYPPKKLSHKLKLTGTSKNSHWRQNNYHSQQKTLTSKILKCSPFSDTTKLTQTKKKKPCSLTKVLLHTAEKKVTDTPKNAHTNNKQSFFFLSYWNDLRFRF